VVEHHPKRRNFLACHPIAGTEKSGPEAAISGLYVGKTNIICEVEKTTFKLQEKALQLLQTLECVFVIWIRFHMISILRMFRTYLT
jgi:prephenate dehydrogenase